MKDRESTLARVLDENKRLRQRLVEVEAALATRYRKQRPRDHTQSDEPRGGYTEMKQALRESEERYRRITQAVTDYIVTVRVENSHPVETTHGASSVAITGYTPEEWMRQP